MQNHNNETQLINAIKRSGYLLESKVAKQLMELGMWVESSVVFQDLNTGKDREIDMCCEFSPEIIEHKEIKIAGVIKFIFEIKNNPFPLVLMSKLPNSPNVPTWESIKEYITIPTETSTSIFKETRFEMHELEGKFDSYEMFTQYCSFQPKKGTKELMAFHPDNLYESISKLCTYTELLVESKNNLNNKRDTFYRNFKYLPVLLINQDLYELEITESNKDEEVGLKKVNSSKLYINYHFKDKPTCSVIYIVTLDGLNDFINEMYDVKNKLVDIMKGNIADTNYT